eukprot:3085028-Rhodomonas_salina.2
MGPPGLRHLWYLGSRVEEAGEGEGRAAVDIQLGGFELDLAVQEVPDLLFHKNPASTRSRACEPRLRSRVSAFDSKFDRAAQKIFDLLFPKGPGGSIRFAHVSHQDAVQTECIRFDLAAQKRSLISSSKRSNRFCA